MSEIEVIKSYRVGNELFNTQEEAEHYLEEHFNEFRKGHREWI